MSGEASSPGEIRLPSQGLEEDVAYFERRFDFRLDGLYPADDPRVALLSGQGLRIRLERASEASEAPPRPSPGEAEPGTTVLSRLGSGAGWSPGRAGMLYRDLIPGRLGGRLIASHLRIPQGGEVPDRVHFHELSFQLIYCLRGWVRVVYEDQGPPFRMLPGDCVVQPPKIRHRVLESSAGLEVLEIASPAEHLTGFDHEIELPTPRRLPERVFGGQRFLRHEAATAEWTAEDREGLERRELGVAEATAGLATARVARTTGAGSVALRAGPAPLFAFILAGTARLREGALEQPSLGAGDALLLPAGAAAELCGCDPELEIFELEARLDAAATAECH